MTRFPFGSQSDFLLNTAASLLGHTNQSGSLYVYEKRLSQNLEESLIGTVCLSAFEVVGDATEAHLTALLKLIAPCDNKADPFPEVYCNGRRFDVPVSNDDPFAFIYPVPQHCPGSSFEKDALAILSDYVWFGISCDRAHQPVQQPEQVTTPDIGDRVSRRIGRKEIQPLHGVAQSEPLILTLARFFAAFCSYHPLTDAKGTSLNVPFFQLRAINDWIVELSHRPSANEIFAYLSRICNIACEFCYLFGNPATISIARGAKTISKNEMSARLDTFRPHENRRLFEATWEVNEVLVDPNFEQVARRLRTISDEPFLFITNGNPLTAQKVALLDELKPVELIISTNTTDPTARSELMNEKETLTNVALCCFDDLCTRQISYGVSMVAMPDQAFDDLEETILQVNKYHPAFIRINLVGYTRDHPAKIEFDTFYFWEKTVRWVQELRETVSTPIIVIPSAFEENFCAGPPNAARVIGTIQGSPAAKAGLRPRDEIVGVGRFETRSRAQVRGLLSVLDQPTPLSVLRDGKQLEIILDPTELTHYPFVCDMISKYFLPKGVVLAPALSPSDFDKIRDEIISQGVTEAAILTSQLMQPAVDDLLSNIDLGEAHVHLVKVQNNFLGGNICVLDMATVTDMVTSVRANMGEKLRELERLFVPASSFNHLGRDLAGNHWSDVERALGVPVTIVDKTTQFAF